MISAEKVFLMSNVKCQAIDFPLLPTGPLKCTWDLVFCRHCCWNSGGKIGFLVDHSDRQSNEWFSHYSSICPSQNFTIDAFLTECRHHNCSFAANLGNILISGSRSVEFKSGGSWLWGTVVILFSKTGFVVFTNLQKTKIETLDVDFTTVGKIWSAMIYKCGVS